MKNLITCLVVCMFSGVTDAQTPRTILEKPDLTVVPSGYYEDQIFVRIHEGIDAQTAISSMTNQRDINAIAEIAGATWRMVTVDSQKNLVGEKLEYAERRLGREIADPRQGLYLKLPMRAATAKAIDALNTSPLVEIALPVPIPEPASFTPPDYQSDQGYENPAAHGGIGAETVWSTFDIHGEGVQVCDIEWDFNANHCDFPSVQILGNAPYGNHVDHGTAVLGAMVSLNDGVGTTGISHGVDAVKFASLDSNGLSSAILLATNNMPAGSVILLEVQMSGPNGGDAWVPVEWYEPYYNSVLYAVGNDMIVCEAAGNGYQDLDASIYSQGNGGHYPFLPENDSGAIMIGAGGAYNSCYGNTWKARLDFSNYGSRVDVQGWGECVMTTGYGSAWNEDDCDYTATFNGTSSATPIVAGACLLVQSYAIDQLGGPLSPSQLRSLIVDTGQPQTNPSSGHIGPLPDAYAAISSFLSDGACCIGTSGACIEIIEPNCNASGGIWQGDKTTCSSSCVAPQGACCVSETCYEYEEYDCEQAGGDYAGDETNCNSLGSYCGPIQWNENGHWYQLFTVDEPGISPEAHFLIAESMGGHTATISSSEENAICLNLAPPWTLLGIRKENGTNQGWVTGEPWNYSNWEGGEGNNEWELYGGFTPSGTWWDTDNSLRTNSIIEWDADCNDDNIVDYGQILDGTLADKNSNGIPDICECSADITSDGYVNVTDLLVVIDQWGSTDSPADVTQDGIVDVSDVLLIIGNWGPCE